MKELHFSGKIAECGKHESLHPLFAKAFDFLRRPDLAQLAPGRYKIDGDNCWASIAEVELKPVTERKLEAHRKYIDIHSPITGSESLGFAVMDERASALPFDEEKDCVFLDGACELQVVNPGEYVVFYPLLAHAPACSVPEGARKIRKVVVKILAEM